MDLRHLQTFKVIAETGSFVQAKAVQAFSDLFKQVAKRLSSGLISTNRLDIYQQDTTAQQKQGK